MMAADIAVVVVDVVGTITFLQISLPVATLTATVSASESRPPFVAVVPIRYAVAPSGLRAAESRFSVWPVFSLAHFWAPVPAEKATDVKVTKATGSGADPDAITVPRPTLLTSTVTEDRLALFVARPASRVHTCLPVAAS